MIELSTNIPDLVRILFESMNFVRNKKKSRAKELKHLADRKFSEIKASHDLFINLIGEIENSSRLAQDSLKQRPDLAYESVSELYQRVNQIREQNIDYRIERRTEAKAYIDDSLRDFGFFTAFDIEIISAFKKLMIMYLAYFTGRSHETHDLANALIMIRGTLKMNPQTSSTCALGFEVALNDIIVEAEKSIIKLRASWGDMATSYHEFGVALFKRNLL